MSIDNRSQIFHIGLHKTATTFLQGCYFPNLIEDDGTPVSWRRPGVESILSGKHRSCRIVSQENLSGVLEPEVPGASWARFETFLEALRKSRQTSKIILFIRPHQEWLLSAYVDRVKRGFRGSFLEYAELFSIMDLSWEKRIAECREVANETFVVTYPKFKTNPEETLKRLTRFLRLRTTRPLRDLISGSPRLNVSPKTEFALTVARVAYSRIGRKALRLLSRAYFQNAGSSDSMRDRLVATANRVPHARPLLIDPSLPGSLSKRLEDDWNSALRALEKDGLLSVK